MIVAAVRNTESVEAFPHADLSLLQALWNDTRSPLSLISENIYEHSVKNKTIECLQDRKARGSFIVSAWSLSSAENAVHRISPSVSEDGKFPLHSPSAGLRLPSSSCW